MSDKFNQKLQQLLKLLDTTNSAFIDVKEIPFVIRALGYAPTQQQITELIQKMFDSPETPTEKVSVASVEKVLKEAASSFHRIDQDSLYRAFASLDAEKKGFLLPDDLKNYLTSLGEAFTQEEVEEMLSVCVDSKEGKVYYADFVALLA